MGHFFVGIPYSIGVIPRGLREKVVPAEHMHTPRFMEKWKAKCLAHGLLVFQLIVDEEKAQLDEFIIELEQSSKVLVSYGRNLILRNTMIYSKRK